MSTPEDQPSAREHFRVARIMTIAGLIRLLSCSRSTVQRRLRQWGCHTSYNLNGRYYVLPEVVQFDQRGLWYCGQARFSVHGNLRQTVSALVQHAEAGMTAAELSAVLGVNANSFLWGFMQQGALSRQQIRGRFLYVSSDAETRSRQCHRRRRMSEQPLSDADAVAVLVAFVKEPTLEAGQLAGRVRARAPTATAQAIRRFLAAHGLSAAKKGALRSPPSSGSGTIDSG